MMTVDYRINEDQKLVYVCISGDVTLHEMLDHLDALSADPGYTAPMKKIIDFRYCRSYPLTGTDQEIVARKKTSLSRVFDREKCAILAPNDLEYGMSRVHQALTIDSGIDTMVFRNLEETLDWLKIEKNDFDMSDLTGCFA